MITLSASEADQLARLIPELNKTPKGLFVFLSIMDHYENYAFKVVQVRYQDGSDDEWILTEQGSARLNERKP